jgi:N-acetylneuraminic acid mutarotase
VISRRQALLAAAAVPLSAGVLSAPARAPSWSSAAALPFATQEIYPTVHGGRLYVAGGIAARLGVPYFTGRCISFGGDAGAWRDEAELPEALHHTALVSTGTQLFAVGGFNGGYTHVWRMREQVYRLGEDGWRLATPLPRPMAEGVVACAPDGLVHLVTGQSPRGEANQVRSDHVEVHDHLCLDPSDGRWRQRAPIPTARNSATGGWLGGHLVVAGGRTAAGNLAVTEVYDPVRDVWYEARPMPLPQAGTASVVLKGELIVFGGEIFQPEAGVFSEVWRYSLADDRWQPLPAMPTPRHGIGAGVLNGSAHVVGGAVEPGGSGTSAAHEVLSLG